MRSASASAARTGSSPGTRSQTPSRTGGVKTLITLVGEPISPKHSLVSARIRAQVFGRPVRILALVGFANAQKTRVARGIDVLDHRDQAGQTRCDYLAALLNQPFHGDRASLRVDLAYFQDVRQLVDAQLGSNARPDLARIAIRSLAPANDDVIARPPCGSLAPGYRPWPRYPRRQKHDRKPRRRHRSPSPRPP